MEASTALDQGSAAMFRLVIARALAADYSPVFEQVQAAAMSINSPVEIAFPAHLLLRLLHTQRRHQTASSS
jgi:hypothetical protein